MLKHIKLNFAGYISTFLTKSIREHPPEKKSISQKHKLDFCETTGYNQTNESICALKYKHAFFIHLTELVQDNKLFE